MPLNRPIKAILFDKDGTLIDFQATWGAATKSTLSGLANADSAVIQRLAEIADFDLVTGEIGPSSAIIAGTPADLAEIWAPILQAPDIAALETRINALYSGASLSSLRGFETTESTLHTLRGDDMPLGVATNDSEENAKLHMHALGWSDCFTAIMGYDSGFGAKPGPGMALAFAEKIGIAPANIAMVGDSTHDLHCAKAAGAIAIGVTTGPARQADLSPHADQVIDGLEALLALI